MHIYDVGTFSKEQKSKQEIHGSILWRIEGTLKWLKREVLWLTPCLVTQPRTEI